MADKTENEEKSSLPLLYDRVFFLSITIPAGAHLKGQMKFPLNIFQKWIVFPTFGLIPKDDEFVLPITIQEGTTFWAQPSQVAIPFGAQWLVVESC